MTVLLALLLLAAEPDVAARLTAGKAAFESLELELAAMEFVLAARDPAATDAQRIEANLWAGMTQRVLGHDTEARLHFLYVLKRDPLAKLPIDPGPKVTTFFELVREEITPPTASPAPTPTPAPDAAPSGPPWPWVAGVGGLVVGGASVAAVAVGSGPWFAHAEAREALAVAAATGADGSELQARQRQARADWESWGAATTTLGVVGAGVGALAVGGGLLLALGAE